jgi:hypothetical protein
MNAESFGQALRQAGLDAPVEAQGKVAVLGAPLPLDPATRRRVVALGREHGFANVAVELMPDADLPGD